MYDIRVVLVDLTRLNSQSSTPRFLAVTETKACLLRTAYVRRFRQISGHTCSNREDALNQRPVYDIRRR